MSTVYGTMDGAYFVGRNELLQWLNDLLGLSYTKVEQCANGAAYCQIMDAVYPGEVPLKKVNFNAKLEHDFIKNYKVLQTVFEKKKIAKVVEVNKLVRGKQMDNLEMLQWLKRYWNIHCTGQPYNAVERRNGANKENELKLGESVLTTTTNNNNTASHQQQQQSSAGKRSRAGRTTPTKSGRLEEEFDDVMDVTPMKAEDGEDGSIGAISAERAQQLMEEVAAMSITINEIEKERDFFFEKLREIEIYVQTKEEPATTKMCEAIKQILYSMNEEETGPSA